MVKTALVTGGAGFVGSTLVDRLIHDGGWKVICLDSFDDFYDRERKWHNIEQASGSVNFTLVEGDICDRELLDQALQDPVDVIVHLAARAGVRPSIQRPRLYEHVNVGGTMNLLEFAREREVPQFVFASSSSVYGTNPGFPWSESENVLRPISPYAATKVAGELMGHTYSQLYGIRFIALRLFTVFGPRQRPDLAIHKFYSMMTGGLAIPFFGDGSSSRDYTYVDDIVEGLLSAMAYDRSAFEVVNLGNNRSVSLSEMVRVIEEVAGVKAVQEKLPPQPGDVPHTRADISKAATMLGYQPATSLEAGIKRFHEWFGSLGVKSGSL